VGYSVSTGAGVIAHMQDFLDIVGGERGVSRELCDFCRIEFHVRTEPAWGDVHLSKRVRSIPVTLSTKR
jgi:hypothetical protein